MGMPDCLLEGEGGRRSCATAKVVFNQEVLDVIAQTRGQMEEELDHRHYRFRVV